MKGINKHLGVVLLLFFVLAGQAGQAQTKEYYESDYGHEYTASRLYLTPGIGFNTHHGILGASLEYNFAKNLSAYGGIGLGTWGYKMGTGIRYYLDFPSSWAFNLGFSHATGVDQLTLDMDPSMVLGGSSGTQEVTFNFKPVNNINLTAIKYWAVGRRKVNRIHLEFGYAFNLTEDFYSADATLSNEGNNFMRFFRPGGLVLGTGFGFGL